MAITLKNIKHKPEAGFALLIAVIFMSVMLTFGLALGSLSYKQQVLASSAAQSQYAFYAADTALECALFYDQQSIILAYPATDPPSAPAITCDGSVAISATKVWSSSQWVVTNRLSLNSGNLCADIEVYKPNGIGTTYLFAQGYNVSCDAVDDTSATRFVSRGIHAKY